MLKVYGLFPLCSLLFAVGLATTPAAAQSKYAHAAASSDRPADAPPPMRVSPALIIKKFLATETAFREALIQFSFKRDVVLQTIGEHGEVTGEYIRNSAFLLDDRGQRVERVLEHPKSTIKALTITKEDIQDLAGSQLFGLEPAEFAAYDFAYRGEDILRGQRAYVIDVNTRREPDPRNMRARFFVGRIWIDAGNFQVVQLRGVTTPHGKQRFPIFQTERSPSAETLLLPSITIADDVLRFPHKEVRYRIRVRYYDFKKFASRLKLVELDPAP